MKRSEMAKKIATYLESTRCKDGQILGSTILAIVEESGMAPPHQEVTAKRDYGTFIVDGEREWDEE